MQQLITQLKQFGIEPDVFSFLLTRLLSSYIETRQEEIASWNGHHAGPTSVLNQRKMTNVGTFRAYLTEYLRQHPSIRKDMTLMVRQMAPGETGLPLEIYAFTNTVACWNTKVFRQIFSTMCLPLWTRLAYASIRLLPGAMCAPSRV